MRNPTMNKEMKEKWVAALRSGNYKQGYNNLKKYGCYCCLGVLCDVVGCQWTDCNRANYDGHDTNNMTLPANLRIAAGLSEEQESELVDMNDHHKVSFDDIADYIESNL